MPLIRSSATCPISALEEVATRLNVLQGVISRACNRYAETGTAVYRHGEGWERSRTHGEDRLIILATKRNQTASRINRLFRKVI